MNLYYVPNRRFFLRGNFNSQSPYAQSATIYPPAQAGSVASPPGAHVPTREYHKHANHRFGAEVHHLSDHESGSPSSILPDPGLAWR